MNSINECGPVWSDNQMDRIEQKLDHVLNALSRVEPHIDKAVAMMDSPAAKLAGMLRKR